ncbi:molybdenum cofactor guanylyltransferase [Alteribacter populi]|uniref:molybdenum cofactor guanylyltransferase n=1 Tax=Alteribacter populi TaxID=2011011 RepID=UPI0012FE6406|nr:molybdenum cofactor guanylyltransferase [Alteribacter populi]
MKLTGIILAGGKSSRMGTNKALLKVNSVSVISRIKRELSYYCDSLFVVTNDPGLYTFLDVPITEDHYKNKGPLAGIHAGLSESSTEWNLVVACDVPLINSQALSVLTRIVESKQGRNADVILPIASGRYHPMLALYRKSVLPEVTKAIKANRLKLMDVIHLLNVVEVDERGHGVPEKAWEECFFNMNNPAEYEEICNRF